MVCPTKCGTSVGQRCTRPVEVWDKIRNNIFICWRLSSKTVSRVSGLDGLVSCQTIKKLVRLGFKLMDQIILVNN